MRLKPIPANTVVHTPTKEEAKELLAILHENGWITNGFENYAIKNAEGIQIESETTWSWWEKIENARKENRTILTLSKFKERYCEMTEPLTEKAKETSVIQQKPQPKFKVNDIVKVVGYQTDCIASMGTHVGEVGVIIRAVKDDENYFKITCDNGLYSWHKDWLEPYTEPETKPTENMETKEMNLCELLQGYEGELFFSPCYGNVTLSEVRNDRIIITAKVNGKKHTLCPNGTHISGAVLSCVNLLPSVGLYEQYPLDPYTAWMKWQEELLKCKMYLMIEDECNENLYSDSFMFRSPVDRDKCIGEIKAIIEKYSK